MRALLSFVVRAFLEAVARVVALMPFAWLVPMGRVVGFLAGTALRIRRRHVVASMRTAGIAEPERVADAMYAGLGASALEFLWLAGRARPDVGKIARLDEASCEELDRAERVGRGVILAGAHTGNWELAAAALAVRGELVVVAKRLEVAAVDQFARAVRAAYGVRLADPEGALAVAHRVLARKGRVAMLIDQVPARRAHGVRESFLAAPALVDRAPAALAWRTGAPLVITAARRAADGTHVLQILATLIPPVGCDRAWIVQATREATRFLEQFVRAHPSQWLWLHRRWREPLERPQAPDLDQSSSGTELGRGSYAVPPISIPNEHGS